jgi:O-6-methylguanine DNA methyltransferase
MSPASPSSDAARQRDGVVATTAAAPWGPVYLAATRRGIVALEMTSTREAFVEHLERRFGAAPAWLPDHVARLERPDRRTDDPAGNAAATHLRTAVTAIEAVVRAGSRAAGDELATLPVDLSDRPAWAIPRGEIRSYGDIARAVDRPGAARAVGGAVGRNPVAFLIPCHRVVAGDGTLGGYGGGWWGDHERLLDLKAELLVNEGVTLPRSRPRGSRGR